MNVYFLQLLFILTGTLVLLAGLLVIKFNRAKSIPDGLSFCSRLKSTLYIPFTDFIRMNLAIIVILMIIRSAQYFFLSSSHILPPGSIFLELHGFIHDLIIWQLISWAILIPFAMFSLLKRWTGILFFGIIFLVYAVLEWTLFEYFTVTLTPLDEVVFHYSLKEMAMIAGNSVRISILSFLPYFILFLITPGLILVFLKLRVSKYLLIGFTVISLNLIVFRHSLIPNEAGCRMPFEYFIGVNKTDYLARKCIHHLAAEKQSVSIMLIEEATKRYQAQHTEFNFLGTRYPFLHYDDTPDVLSSFFNLKPEKPNLVVIIVESLSSCFSGNNTVFGSFTPFLDSLAGHSLYWPNFLSTADRTFNVIEAVTGSMPPGYDSFLIPYSDAKYPYLLSLVSYLEQDGYFTGFYHGGDPTFNNMDDFLIHQKTDYILRYFGPGYSKLSTVGGASWGYSDSDMFSRAFEVLDSIKKSPRLDLYLTVSTHTPFIIPNQQYWLSQAGERINKSTHGLSAKADLEKNRTIFSAVMYSDHALQELIGNYKKRPGYDNTIFLITGDHAMPELSPSDVSLIERFHVPLIIFSPMLKKNATFLSVSSHLDITPTLLALLHNKFGLEINSVAPWLGSGIDTTSFFRNSHSLPFILNNREIIDYVDHLFYLSPFNLLEIPPDFHPLAINNPPVEARMKRELNDVKILSKYILEQNRLVPQEVYFGKFLLCDTLKIPPLIPYSQNDSVWEYKRFCNHIPIGSKYKLIKLVTTFDFMIGKTAPEKPPKIVFDLYGKEGKQIIYNSFEVSRDSLKTAKQGVWKSARFEEYIDLSYLKGKEKYSLLLYMWNPRRSNFRVTNPAVKIYGFY